MCIEPLAPIGYIERVNGEDLEEIPQSSFQLVLELISDTHCRFIPSKEVRTSIFSPSSIEHPAPFKYFATIQFSN
jgi:hypothetical protein